MARIALTGIEQAGQAYKNLPRCSPKENQREIVLSSRSVATMSRTSLSRDQGNLQPAIEVLRENKEYIGFTDIETDENIVKVSVVGAGMASNAGVASMVFEALNDANINIHMISTSEIKISVLLDAADGDRAMRVIHDKFDFYRVKRADPGK